MSTTEWINATCRLLGVVTVVAIVGSHIGLSVSERVWCTVGAWVAMCPPLTWGKP